jgi:peroxidase
MAGIVQCFVTLLTIVVLIPTSSGQLTADFYDKVCPQALPTVKSIVQRAIMNEARMGASLLRLHFHDCFVNGCDGSTLLDDTANFIGEKTSVHNLNSLRGFDVVDEIKAAVNSACNGNVVSCADILAIAARDSVNILGGPCYNVLLGRKDSLTASLADANADIPSPFSNFAGLLLNFQSQGLDLKDLIVLSGGHTIGLARCVAFTPRIYNDTDINPSFATSLKNVCPVNGDGNNTAPLDATTTIFDTVYFQGLTQQKGLLHSDQELFNGGNSQSANLVTYYSNNRAAFWEDFGDSMIKMGNLPAASSNGQVRLNCRKVN